MGVHGCGAARDALPSMPLCRSPPSPTRLDRTAPHRSPPLRPSFFFLTAPVPPDHSRCGGASSSCDAQTTQVVLSNAAFPPTSRLRCYVSEHDGGRALQLASPLGLSVCHACRL